MSIMFIQSKKGVLPTLATGTLVCPEIAAKHLGETDERFRFGEPSDIPLACPEISLPVS